MHSGETVVIIGNGRSLEQIDLSQLDKYTTYGGNYILDIYSPTYYMVMDEEVIKNWNHIKDKLHNTTPYVRKDLIAGHIENVNPISWLDLRYPNSKHYGGNITTVCLQLAFHHDVSKAYLIGCDWGNPRLHHRGMEPYQFIEQQRPVPPQYAIDRHTTALFVALHRYHAYNKVILNLSPGTSMPIIPTADVSLL